MDAAVKILEVTTALARDNGKWNEQHSKVRRSKGHADEHEVKEEEKHSSAGDCEIT